MNFIKYLICSLMLVVGLSLTTNTASALLSAIDDEPASQVIAYYNTQDSSSFALQITNTNVSTGVTVHFQTINSIKDADDNVVDCAEVKNDTVVLTGADTIILDEATLGIPADSEGFVIVFAVDAANVFLPIAFPHLIGTALISESGVDVAMYNAAGRNLTGGVYDLIQPVDVIAVYDDLTLMPGPFFDAHIASVAWIDNYTGNGAYDASAGTALADGNDDIPVGILSFDHLEDNFSCGDALFVCASCAGTVPSGVGEESALCSHLENSFCTSDNDSGYLNFVGIDSLDNLVVLAGQSDTTDLNGIDYAALTDLAAGVEPPVDCEALEDPCDDLVNCLAECQAQECEDLDDCAEDICDGFAIAPGAVCSGGVATETDCTDEFEGVPVDNDGDLLANCADPDCDADPACQQEGGGGGGGGGCSIATGSVGLANALLLLIPALGIAIRRRLIG